MPKKIFFLFVMLFASIIFMSKADALCQNAALENAEALIMDEETKYCDTLNSALSELTDKQNIKLLKDITIDNYISIYKSFLFTIDFDNHKITFNDGNMAYFGLLIYSDVNLKNGYILANVNNQDSYAVTIAKNATVKLLGMNVESKKGNAINLYQDNNVLIIDKDSFITSYDNAAIVAFAGPKDNYVPSHHKLVVSGTLINKGTTYRYSAINGSFNDNITLDITIEEDAVISSLNGTGILQMSKGDVVIKGKVSGYSSAIAMTKGSLTIEDDAELLASGEGEKTEFTPSQDGKIFDNGSAIYLEPNSPLNVNIKGGKVISKKNYAISAPASAEANHNLTISITGGFFEGAKEELEINGIPLENGGFVKGGTFANLLAEKYLDKTVNNIGQAENGKVGKVYTISKVAPINGNFIVNKNAVVGDTIKIEVNPEKGYKLDNIYVTYKVNDEEKNVSVTKERTFVMPEANVQVQVIFSKVRDVTTDTSKEESKENPKTFDNITNIMTLTMVTIVALGLVFKKITSKN